MLPRVCAAMAEGSNKAFYQGINPLLQDQHVVSFQASAGNNITGMISGTTRTDGVTSLSGPIPVWDSSVNDLFARNASGTSSSNNTRLGHNLELSANWSPEEDATLKEGLVKYATEGKVMKYIKIAAMLQQKTVRDVALRCRWMGTKQNAKKRKPDKGYAGKEMRDRKEVDCSSKVNVCDITPSLNHCYQGNQFYYEGPMLDAASQQILLENALLIHQIRTNFSKLQIADSIDLFFRTRDNIAMILNRMNQMPGVMSKMPPLPPVNEELFRYLLPNTNQAFPFDAPGNFSLQRLPRC